MEIFGKKIILWASVGAAMILVFVIWALSWKNYNFSGSTKEIKELKQEVQKQIKDADIKMPDLNLDASVGAIHELPLLPLSD